ncbi:hypothetical protein ABK040_011949 [Willaertia magna]
MSLNNKQRLCTERDADSFDIHFEAILDHDEAFNCFTNFLQQSYNNESALFLIQINEYRKIKYEKTRLQKANEIVTLFIKEGAENQLNLKASIRKGIETTIETWNRSAVTNNNDDKSENSLSTDDSNNGISNYRNVNNDKSLFDEAENSILLSLKGNQFCNFLKHEHFKQFIVKYPLQFLYEIGSPKENSDLSFIESFNNFGNEYVTLLDFKFLKHKLMDDKDWTLVDHSRNHKCHISTNTFDFCDSTGVHFIKSEATFPNYTIQQVMNTLCDRENRIAYDPNLKEILKVNYLPATKQHNNSSQHTQFATSITHEIYNLTWPFTDRDFVGRTSTIYDKTDNIYLMAKLSVENENTPKPRKGTIRALSLGGWAFQLIDLDTQQIIPSPPGEKVELDGRKFATRFYQIFFIDFKGKIPKAVVNKLWQIRAKSFYKIGIKFLKQNEKNGFICKDDVNAIKTLEENGAVEL